MPLTQTSSAKIRAITSCVPAKKFDNLNDASGFDKEEVKKVVRMAGVKSRHIVEESVCSSDLCVAAAKDVLASLEWDPDSIDALILVTQSPDYFLPSSSCIAHQLLGLPTSCAAFDVGLGCSGYPYAIWLASMMLQSPGFNRVLILHGETPSRFTDPADRAVGLLFGDAGSATALEANNDSDASPWWFSLHTDGSGSDDLIIEGGGFRNRFPEDSAKYNVRMNGPNVFNFTLKRVLPLIEDTLGGAAVSHDDVDYFIFHQSNQFIMKHLAQKAKLPQTKLPMTIGEFGSAGGPSVPLTITKGELKRPKDKDLKLLLLGYGVGLSWGSALLDLSAEATLNHIALG